MADERLPGVSRRRLLQGGGAVVAGATIGGVGFDLGRSDRSGRPATASAPPTTAAAAPAKTGTSSMTSAPAPRFASRPDLQPPHLQLTRSAPLAPGLILLTPTAGTATQPGPLIADDDGEPVWFRPLPTGSAATNLRVQQHLGQPVLTWWEGVIGTGWGRGEAVIADASYREIARVPAGNGLAADLHDLVLTSRGTALVTAYHPARADLSALGGPRAGYMLDSGVQEVDLATGEVRFEWLAGDHVPLSETHNPLDGYGSQPDQPFDPYHANSVSADADGDLLVSFRHLSAVLKIRRADGSVAWRLGGSRSTYAVSPSAMFSWQHDAVRQPDGTITVFDNGGSSQKEEHPSRGLVVRLDEQAHTATLVRSYQRAGRDLALSQGNVQVLPDGEAFVGWGAEPYFTGYDAAGRRALDGRFVEATASYRAFRAPWVGRPAERPAVATRLRTDGAMDVLTSWNGATEVARWDVLAGPAMAALARVAGGARQGFETTVPVLGHPAFVATVALDRAGRELARSLPLRT